MSTPQYLVHTGNGRVFPFSAGLAKRKDMQPAPDLDAANAAAKRFGGQTASLIAQALPHKPENVPAVSSQMIDQDSQVAAISETLQAQEQRIADLESQVAAMSQPSEDVVVSKVDDAASNESGTTEQPEDDTFVISKATKDQLEAFAKEQYNVDLDKRRSIADLRDEVRKLAESAE